MNFATASFATNVRFNAQTVSEICAQTASVIATVSTGSTIPPKRFLLNWAAKEPATIGPSLGVSGDTPEGVNHVPKILWALSPGFANLPSQRDMAQFARWRRDFYVHPLDERVVLIERPGDAQFTWHERVLLLECQPGVWLCWTPEFQVEEVRLMDHRVIHLESGGRYPDRTAYNVRMFAAITHESLESA